MSCNFLNILKILPMLLNSRASRLTLEVSAPHEVTGSAMLRELMALSGSLEGREMISMLDLKLLPVQVIT